MTYENGSIEATLLAAAGGDSALLLELRSVFCESLGRQIDLLKRSRCDANWVVSAYRLKGLAASFHAEQLILLADEAIAAAPGDPVVVRQIERFYDEFSSV